MVRYVFALVILFPFLSGCQMGYIVKNGYHQAKILAAREPIDQAIANPRHSPEIRKKLQLIKSVRQFATEELGLEASSQYDSYVELNRPYVTFTVNAAPKFSLEHYYWHYPLVGELPYKGFFVLKEAKEEAKSLQKDGYDTFVRGVTAYSTLGWFDDPVLSSMMSYREHRLVNLIIHESVHATLYIPSKADFNEQLATFLGNKGTQIYYRKTEGAESPALSLIEEESHDETLYSEFISREIEDLKDWYESRKGKITEAEKRERLKAISQRYTEDLAPRLKVRNFQILASGDFNNAYLMLQKTYVEDLSRFEKAYQKQGGDFKKFLAFVKNLEDSETPAQDLLK